MNLIKLYVICRIPLAFLISFFLSEAKFVVNFKTKVKKPLSKIKEKSSGFAIFLLLFFLTFLIPFSAFYGIFFLSRHFYIPFIAYFGFLLDIYCGSQCLKLKKILNLKGENFGNTIEDISRLLCVKSVAPIIFYAIGGTPLVFLYVTLDSVSKKLAIKSLANYIVIKISIWLSFFCVFLMPAIFKPINAVKVYFKYKYIRGDSLGKVAALFAGSLGIVLGGDLVGEDRANYRPLIGEKLKETDEKDVKKAKKLAISVSVCVVVLCSVLRTIFEFTR